MSESFPTTAALDSLSGTTGSSGLPHMTIGESPYYSSFLKLSDWLDRMLAPTAAALQVYKDGDLTFGVRAGKFRDQNTQRSFAAVSDQSLTDDATNYIYITADGTLTKNTTGFPTASAAPHIPLASIATGTASAAATSGSYATGDITDYRSDAMFNINGTSDSLHLTASITAAAEAANARDVTVQLQDLANVNVSARGLVRAWLADTAYGAPAAADSSVTISTGTTIQTITTDAHWLIASNSTGEIVINIPESGTDSHYLMVEIAGKIYASDELTYA